MHELNNKPEIGYRVCLFGVQFVNGGVAGSVIYGPYDFNPGSRRVHNALSCRNYTQPQAAPLLLSAFHLCPFSSCFSNFSSYSVHGSSSLTAIYLGYKAMADHFFYGYDPHLPGVLPFFFFPAGLHTVILRLSDI